MKDSQCFVAMDSSNRLSLTERTMKEVQATEGAGTGVTTSIILNGLISPSGERMYPTYTFSDLSAGFFVAAKERFQGFQNVQYAKLDISQDPVEQGFEEDSFDFIAAANVSRIPG